MFSVLGPSTNPAVLTVPEDQVRSALNLPCKNVDLQTKARWGSSRGRPGWTGDRSGYLPVALIADAPVTAGLQNALAPTTAAGGNLGKTGGWFFSCPADPKPPPDYDSRRMIKGPFPSDVAGAVINLNPCCFGETYWIGGMVGSTYMGFAAWIPYSSWVDGELPILVHFRPYYNDPSYREASDLATRQGVPAVFAQDKQGSQSYLDGAWYYLLGILGFVQQLLAAQRTAILVFPIPPLDLPKSDQGGSLFPTAFVQQLPSVVAEVAAAAISKAVDVGGGGVTPAKDRLIFSANSQGGAYLMNAARAVKSGLREVWMFDCAAMEEAWNLGGMVRRLYVAQPERHAQLIQMAKSASTQPNIPWEYEGNDWSVVDVSKVPCPGESLHNLAGRLCFSHAAKLSASLAPLKEDAQPFNVTLSGTSMSCWDRLEFWKQRAV